MSCISNKCDVNRANAFFRHFFGQSNVMLTSLASFGETILIKKEATPSLSLIFRVNPTLLSSLFEIQTLFSKLDLNINRNFLGQNCKAIDRLPFKRPWKVYLAKLFPVIWFWKLFKKARWCVLKVMCCEVRLWFNIKIYHII